MIPLILVRTDDQSILNMLYKNSCSFTNCQHCNETLQLKPELIYNFKRCTDLLKPPNETSETSASQSEN